MKVKLFSKKILFLAGERTSIFRMRSMNGSKRTRL